MEKRNYKVTFIINLRATKRSTEELTKWLGSVIAEVGGKVSSVEDIGIRDFVRVTHKNNPNGHYLSFFFSASGDINTALQQKLALEPEIKRTFVESVPPAQKSA